MVSILILINRALSVPTGLWCASPWFEEELGSPSADSSRAAPVTVVPPRPPAPPPPPKEGSSSSSSSNWWEPVSTDPYQQGYYQIRWGRTYVVEHSPCLSRSYLHMPPGRICILILINSVYCTLILINCFGLYDPLNIKHVLHISFKDWLFADACVRLAVARVSVLFT